MDLEERTRGLFGALSSGPASAILEFLSPQAVFEVPGLLPPIGMAKAEPMLQRLYATKPPARFTLLAMKVKRNVVFTGWRAEGEIPGGPGVLEGLAVLHWDQDGKLQRMDLHLGEEAAARLRP